MKTINGIEINKLLSSGYLVYVIAFSFLSLFLWKSFNVTIESVEPFPKFIFYFLLLGIPNLALLFWKAIASTTSYKFSLIDLIFLTFIFWNIVSVGYAHNTAFALNGVVFRITLFLIYINLKWIFHEYPGQMVAVISNTLLIFGFIFIGNYLFFNFDSLLDLLNEKGQYQKVVRKLPSLLGTKNVTAMFLCLVFMLHFSFYNKVTKFKWVHSLFQFIALFMLLILGSRNVYIALIGFTLVVLFFNKKRLSKERLKKFTIYASAIILFITVVSTNKFGKHLQYDTFSTRTNMWNKASKIALEKPFEGQGVYQYLIFKPILAVGNHGHPHNDFIRTFFEHGAPGLALWICLLICPIILANKLLRNSIQDAQLLRLLACLIGYILLCFFDGLQFKISHQIIFLIIISKLDSLLSRDISQKSFFFTLNKYGKNILYIGLFFSVLNIFYCYKFIQAHKTHNEARSLLKLEDKNVSELFKNINTTYYFNRAHNPIYTQLGIIARKENKVTESEQYFKKSLQQYPYNYNTLFELFQCLIEQKREDEAIELLVLLHSIKRRKLRKFLKMLPPEQRDKYLKILVG